MSSEGKANVTMESYSPEYFAKVATEYLKNIQMQDLKTLSQSTNAKNKSKQVRNTRASCKKQGVQ